MSAQDYKICPACFNVFLAKVSKRNSNLMLEDRRIITDEEIFGLIKWKLRQFCLENNTDTMYINFDNKTAIEIKATGDFLEEIKKELEGENK
jgi:hypothetical protein